MRLLLLRSTCQSLVSRPDYQLLLLIGFPWELGRCFPLLLFWEGLILGVVQWRGDSYLLGHCWFAHPGYLPLHPGRFHQIPRSLFSTICIELSRDLWVVFHESEDVLDP